MQPLFKPGDKVRIRTGELAGRRGILLTGDALGWVVELDEETQTERVQMDAMTNYSAAARLAWDRMPNRKVGRPAGSRMTDRVSVIFRIERSLWNQFQLAERDGLVPDRTAVINSCLKKLLKSLSSRGAAKP